MTATWLFLRPRDTVAVRDGRPFDAGAGATARAVFPWPSTVAGAVGSLYGRDVAAVRGPVLGRRLESSHEVEYRPVFPVPADLYATPGSRMIRRLSVRPLPSGITTDLAGLNDFVDTSIRGLEPLDGWLLDAALQRYLADPPTAEAAFDLATDMYVRSEGLSASVLPDEPHVGLTLTERRTAEEGLLYRAHHLRFWDDLGLLVAVDDDDQPQQLAPTYVSLGGEGRLADVHLAKQVSLPAAPAQFPGGRVLLYLATPGIWADGWRPPLPAGARLIAAALKDPVPVATASPGMGKGAGSVLKTSRLHWGVPAGSVYYVQFADADAAHVWVHGYDEARPGVHGHSLGAVESRLSTAGFGVVLAGTWHRIEEFHD